MMKIVEAFSSVGTQGTSEIQINNKDDPEVNF